MRSFLKALAVMAVGLPLAASAQISGSKHDLSSATGASNAVHATAQTQLCIFCHVPHHPVSQALIWNHAPGNAADSFGSTSTFTGTQFGSAALQAPSLKCLACHDGSTAIGAVNNAGGGSAGPITMAAAPSDLNGSFQLLSTSYANLTGGNVGGAGTMVKNHPVSIPYAQATYAGIASSAKATGTVGYYNVVATTGCTSASNVCVTSSVPANGLAINLYGSTGANAGVECGSCHEVHNKYGTANTFFLRAPASGSAICLACHNK